MTLKTKLKKKLFKKLKRKFHSYSTSENIALEPLHILNKILIPLQHVEFDTINTGDVTLFGKVEPIGFVQIENNRITLLSIDQTLNLDELIKNIPELSNMINSAIEPEEVL